jgi:hypothetical protein
MARLSCFERYRRVAVGDSVVILSRMTRVPYFWKTVVTGRLLIQGMPIDVVVTLTPNGDKVAPQVAFAGGAYSMSGTAEKKK